MRKLVCLFILSLLGYQNVSAQYVDDLYVPKNQRQNYLKEQKEYNQQVKQENLNRREEQARVQAEFDRNQQDYANGRYEEYVDDVKSAYQRRIDALSSSSTNSTPFWEAMDRYYEYLEAKYDHDLYNIIVMRDKIWVEPKYISSIFDGSDPTDGLESYKNRMAKNYIQRQKFSSGSNYGHVDNNINLNITVTPFWGGYPYYYSSWNYPWNSWSNPWYRPYGPYWGGGWYDPWYRPYPYWGGGWYNPWYRPIYIDRRPVYHGNSRYNYDGNGNRGSYYGNGRGGYNNGSYGSGGSDTRPRSINAGFGRANQLPSQRPDSRPSVTQNDNYVRGMGGGTQNDRYVPNQNNNRPNYQNNQQREQPSYRPTPTPSYNPSPSPSGGGNSGGGYRGGGGGGRTR